ncbi:MAG: hypothetical protein ABI165_03075 [Bryobacteraceae bacterium]
MAFQSEFAGNAKLNACAERDSDHIGEQFAQRGPWVVLLKKALNAWAARQRPAVKQVPVNDLFGPETGDLVALYKIRQSPQILNFAGKIDRIVGKKTVVALDKELPPGKAVVPLPEATETAATGSMSWIDPRGPLPESDIGGNPGLLATNRATILGKRRYRFANFLEAFINVDFAGVVVGHGFTNDSGLKMNPSSFLGTMPTALRTIQSVELGKDPVRFVQIVGARTSAAEIIIKGLGGSSLDIQVVHSAFGLPPIWTELELTLSSQGLPISRVLRHSLFPSLEWYAQDTFGGHLGHIPNPNTFFNRYHYDGFANAGLRRWMEEGWGPMTAAQGPKTPCPGNPFNMPKPKI